MTVTPALYQDLLRAAHRHSRSPAEAEDLVQDALLAAVAAGRDPGAPGGAAWLAGTIRNQAAFAARSAVRRRRRDTDWQAVDRSASAADDPLEPILQSLPPATKSVAALAFSGHSRAEIRYLLRITDTALRQRLTDLKRALREQGIAPPQSTPGLMLDLNYGRIRDSLLAKLVREGGLFASHDPDGHLFLVRGSQTPAPRQQRGETASRSRP